MTKKLYNNDDVQVMKMTKSSLDKSRIQELIKFANNSGFTKIGIANCMSMKKYADALIEILQENGFNVFAMNCKESGLTYSELFEDETKGPVCDPASQANYLNGKDTEFNINVGLCLGHGLVFNKYSKAPTTTLIVKDFSTGHNTIEHLSD